MINKIVTRLLGKFGKMFAPFSMEGTCAISLQKKRAIPACNDAGQFGESLIICLNILYSKLISSVHLSEHTL